MVKEQLNQSAQQTIRPLTEIDASVTPEHSGKPQNEKVAKSEKETHNIEMPKRLLKSQIPSLSSSKLVIFYLF